MSDKNENNFGKLEFIGTDFWLFTCRDLGTEFGIGIKKLNSRVGIEILLDTKVDTRYGGRDRDITSPTLWMIIEYRDFNPFVNNP